MRRSDYDDRPLLAGLLMLLAERHSLNGKLSPQAALAALHLTGLIEQQLSGVTAAQSREELVRAVDTSMVPVLDGILATRVHGDVRSACVAGFSRDREGDPHGVRNTLARFEPFNIVVAVNEHEEGDHVGGGAHVDESRVAFAAHGFDGYGHVRCTGHHFVPN